MQDEGMDGFSCVTEKITDALIEIITGGSQRRQTLNSESEDEVQELDEWTDPTGNHSSIMPFTGTPGVTLPDHLQNVHDYYSLLVTEDILEEVARQTNIYAAEVYTQERSHRLGRWTPTDKSEIKKLFGLLIWMGLVQLPEIKLYWSTDPVFAQKFPPSVMPRNRFQILMRMLNFANNENDDFDDCLYEIRPIIDKLNENFAKYYNPPEVVCVDQSVIPYRGLTFDDQKCGVKLLRLCFKRGYTYNFQICQQSDNVTTADVVMALCRNVLDKGHTVCVDDRCCSIDLARKLIARNTHLIGKIRPSRCEISKIMQRKLRQGETYAKENKDGITLMKWKNNRDILLLSTKHSPEAAGVSDKPKLVTDYTQVKSSIVSKQATAVSTPLRKTLKWYKKVAFELFVNISVVNAWALYSAQHKSVSVVEFRKRLVSQMCFSENEILIPERVRSIKQHEIKKAEGKARTTRRRCTSCYKEYVNKFGSELARGRAKKVTTYCNDCPNKPFLCLPCFNKFNHQ